MSCKKDKKKCHDKKPCKPKKPCYRDCQKVELSMVYDMTALPGTVLTLVTGDGFSEERVLFLEATVSPGATGAVPASANFQLQVDGVLLDPEITVDMEEAVADLPVGDRRSQVLRAQVRVAPGAHTIALIGTGDVTVELNPNVGGASLLACEKVG